MVLQVQIPDKAHAEDNFPWPWWGWYNKHEWMVLLIVYKDFDPRPARREFDLFVPRHEKYWYKGEEYVWVIPVR